MVEDENLRYAYVCTVVTWCEPVWTYLWLCEALCRNYFNFIYMWILSTVNIFPKFGTLVNEHSTWIHVKEGMVRDTQIVYWHFIILKKKGQVNLSTSHVECLINWCNQLDKSANCQTHTTILLTSVS